MNDVMVRKWQDSLRAWAVDSVLAAQEFGAIDPPVFNLMNPSPAQNVEGGTWLEGTSSGYFT